MNAYDRRIARLEDNAATATAAANCMCASRPAVAVLCADPTRALSNSANYAAEILSFICPVHMLIGPRTHVRIVDPTNRCAAGGERH